MSSSFDELQNLFLSKVKLDELPENFNAEFISDIEPYLSEGYELDAIATAFQSQIDYLHDYNKANGLGAWQAETEEMSAGNLGGPPCFSTWYSAQNRILRTATACCSPAISCSECLSDMMVTTFGKYVAYKKCMNQY